jgi:phage-related protein
MNTEDVPKPVFWVGSCHKDLRGLPPEVRKTFGFALWQAQTGRKHQAAKPLKGFGVKAAEVHHATRTKEQEGEAEGRGDRD